MSFVTTEIQDAVAVLTIDRPKALNALNPEVLADLKAAFEAIDQNTVRCVVLTGAGDKSFVAGADIGEMVNYTADDAKRFSHHGNNTMMHITRFPSPVIAAVNGFALGGGCELAMSCDIRVASEKATFGMPEVGLGITPGFGGTQRLQRIVGMSTAMELVLTSRTIDAQEALQIGLVKHVYPADVMLDKALELANAICANAQIAVQESKRCIRMGMQTDIATGSAFEAEAFGLCFSTEDQKDAMTAFVNKDKVTSFKNR